MTSFWHFLLAFISSCRDTFSLQLYFSQPQNFSHLSTSNEFSKLFLVNFIKYLVKSRSHSTFLFFFSFTFLHVAYLFFCERKISFYFASFLTTSTHTVLFQDFSPLRKAEKNFHSTIFSSFLEIFLLYHCFITDLMIYSTIIHLLRETTNLHQ